MIKINKLINLKKKLINQEDLKYNVKNIKLKLNIKITRLKNFQDN